MFKKFLMATAVLASLLLGKELHVAVFSVDVPQCDRILHKKAFTICYSCAKKIPLAVVYELSGDLVNKNNYSRKGLRFRPDYQLPTRCRSYSKDYSRTGYDRGHLAPNAAFDYSRSVQKETFLMSNIAPQKPYLNRRVWSRIEKFARMQSRKYGRVSVLTGVCGESGRVKRGVAVPKYWFKVIVKPDGNAVSFLAPNTNGLKGAKAKDFLVPVERIEEVCGYGIVF